MLKWKQWWIWWVRHDSPDFSSFFKAAIIRHLTVPVPPGGLALPTRPSWFWFRFCVGFHHENDHMILNASNMFQLGYQDICYVALAAVPTSEWTQVFSQTGQMPQMMMSMMMLIWGEDHYRECPWMNIPMTSMSDTRATWGKRIVDTSQLCIKKCYDPKVKWKRTSSNQVENHVMGHLFRGMFQVTHKCRL